MKEPGNNNGKDGTSGTQAVSPLAVRRLLWINGWLALVILSFGLAYLQHQRHTMNRMILEAASGASPPGEGARTSSPSARRARGPC